VAVVVQSDGLTKVGSQVARDYPAALLESLQVICYDGERSADDRDVQRREENTQAEPPVERQPRSFLGVIISA
jgi:hypothetical protein